MSHFLKYEMPLKNLQKSNEILIYYLELQISILNYNNLQWLSMKAEMLVLPYLCVQQAWRTCQ